MVVFAGSEVKTIVKNTFLECIEEEGEEDQPQILRAQTGPAALRLLAAATSAVAVKAAAGAPGGAPTTAAAGGPEDYDQAPQDSCIAEALAPTPVRAKRQPQDGMAVAPAAEATGFTTVMLRNVPNDYTRDMLLQLLDGKGFAGKYDFAYIPTDHIKQAGLGYAFVNMVTEADAQLVHKRLEGFRQWVVPSSKTCAVGWSNPCQGLEANIARYRNSPIMHECMPDEVKPAMFQDGVRVEFPRPTKRLRKPDLMRRTKSH